LIRAPGVACAVFPHEPARSVYNNALLEHADGVDAMEAAYASASVRRFAAWVHERDEPLRDELEMRGYTLDTATRAMGMALSELPAPPPELDLAPADWPAYVRFAALTGVPEGLLDGVDGNAFHVLIARADGQSASTALAFELDGDCGIYNVGTLEHARRRGLGTAITARLLHDAAARGCRTASLQSTPMAERVYAAVGFRDLGRFLEYVP
jgi:GNAT superfamily N-acetyltransferase